MFIYLTFIAGFFAISAGSQNINFRIAGGDVTSISNHPYIVSIQLEGIPYNNYCTGSIISEDIILTAAHCIPKDFHKLKIRTRSNFSAINGSIHSVESFIRHEHYNVNRDISTNDIALIKVKSPFVFNDIFRPISMFNDGEKISPGSYGTVSGWGKVPQNEKDKSSYDDRRYNQLRSVVVPILEYSVCKKKLKEEKLTILPPGQICAGGNGKGACNGDSGGPLIVDGKLAGVTTWGYGCGDRGFTPNLYSEVAYHRKWIDENMSKLSKQN